MGQQYGLRVSVLNSGQIPLAKLASAEAELVLTADRKKRGDVEGLLADQGLTRSVAKLRAPGAAIQEVDVTITKGVVDLGNDRQCLTLTVFAEPETHWLEGVAQHSRQAAEPDFSIDEIVKASSLELLSGPGQAGATIAVVAVHDL